ncbi:MAG: diaminopimelate epimerase [Acidimicrobiia bacterium]|nr:diaminopimelate epimerase [Acidimicrobiia bacterium]MYC58175.1 diaminopimelate epimerase [Acidimicrobiia bacterium]MYG94338.1 diaminopimelate epimerase [Acidimicrobiia bacterium]MYI30607.1 diaminopimelate epimerase [Acidimicrobiia bacterium]
MRLTKHHGLGNDFLVAVQPDLPANASALAQAVCHRTRGVGADGLIFALRGDPSCSTDVTMVLFNADGGRAEMSGNGIRCLVQAILRQNTVPNVSNAEFRISTDVGVRVVSTQACDDPHILHARVDMGPIGVGPAISRQHVQLNVGNQQVEAQVGTASLGNPHVVLGVSDLEQLDIAVVGPQQSVLAGGSNVEVIAPGPDSQSITMKVWERGVGVTEACGTGACAAAHIAHGWGWVADVVLVCMPGGKVVVELGDTIILGGSVEYIASVEYG